ncbi:DNA adenine methylase [Ciceribacter sp. L1K22]|uniref:DNA adenine methylase n=1 Tax=Ciceribacter sp. L1K22 TaxID=2820275 RepID=UPI001ABE440A|nr:DNA adenine methylase [Ciceribacter sp. L1K22]MBO3760372.1 DNA adenine methylase [Ciceribacter sp. L1K22]
MNDTPTRPALRWHGGKWKLAPWIIAHLPPHRVYVEPYGGAASVLIRKPRAYAEVYNDLDDEVVALFRVLRDPEQAALLRELLRLTPFARTEFKAAYEATDDPIERSRRLIIRSFMGFGSNAHSSADRGHRSTGFRATSNRSGTTPAIDWANYPAALTALVDRLQGVVVENRPALAVMAQHDRPGTLHYVDPPYMHQTRSDPDKHAYRHELSDADHAELLRFLSSLTGMVVLSGYEAPLYGDHLIDWHRLEKATHADGARERTEILWLNPAASEALRHSREMPLFSKEMAR